jgi:hypothetical protein
MARRARGDRPQWAVSAKADSFWQLLMLHGAVGDRFEAKLLVRGADVLRHADGLVQPKGLTPPARSASHGAQKAGSQDVPENAEPRQKRRGTKKPRPSTRAHAHH